jgi:hypothetical protein
VQVGPDCTWVKSRILTPSSALPASPHGLLLGRASAAFGFLALSFTTFLADLLPAALAFARFVFFRIGMLHSQSVHARKSRH